MVYVLGGSVCGEGCGVEVSSENDVCQCRVDTRRICQLHCPRPRVLSGAHSHKCLTFLISSFWRHVHSLARSIDAYSQEFFITSHSNYLGRPDLLHTGRTLLGALPARAQQVSDDD